MDYPYFRSLQDERYELLHLYAWLKVANVEINRKMLAEMAINDAVAFTALCELAEEGLSDKLARRFFSGSLPQMPLFRKNTLDERNLRTIMKEVKH